MSSNIVRLNSWRPYTVSMGDDIMKILWALTVLHSWDQLDYSTSINLSAQPELKLGKTFPKTFGLKGSCCRINTSQEVGQMSSCYLGQTTNITLLRTMANALVNLTLKHTNGNKDTEEVYTCTQNICRYVNMHCTESKYEYISSD